MEKGKYKNGHKTGTWQVTSLIESDMGKNMKQTKVEWIKFKDGRPKKSVLVIMDLQYEYEDYGPHKIRKQKIRKRYKYY